jgi:NADP-dependent 3-hydroxy acid dehydrogenase YdfG
MTASGEELAGRTFVVTGGASGLGEATARSFHDTGANVVLVDLNLEVVPSCCSDFFSNLFFLNKFW